VLLWHVESHHRTAEAEPVVKERGVDRYFRLAIGVVVGPNDPAGLVLIKTQNDRSWV
jgi:hypothetical protein